MAKTMHTKRNPALDIIRIFALLFVISVHFFLNCGYYDVAMQGAGMYLATFLRSFLMVCVPLFLLLTGYLTADRTATWAYYRKLVDTLGVYILASLCCVAYKLYSGSESFRFYRLVNDIMSYCAAPYGWYVEMYIGLFLMCPFLNAGYQALESKKKKQCFLAVLLLLTALPGAINVYRPWLSWFRNPGSSEDYLQILPDYWTRLYPFLYYFIGSYIREYGVAILPRKALLASIALMLFQGFYNIWRCYGNSFVWGPWQDHGSLFVVVQSVLFFVMILNLDLSRLSERVRKNLSLLSGLCFGAYLVSYIFDNFFSTRLNAAISYVPYRFPYFFIEVPLVFFGSLALSFLINGCYGFVKKGVLRVCAMVRKETLHK